ncbi:unnamed protein product [Paramecium sonneborni]|uniref:Transmembrane protein n=1 Tax=Paramecium sonneborni TaxID=65129 RepID=A0A8S1R9N9_9CILI|nr:unnamed protein product [Paramecium sonneborni]
MNNVLVTKEIKILKVSNCQIIQNDRPILYNDFNYIIEVSWFLILILINIKYYTQYLLGLLQLIIMNHKQHQSQQLIHTTTKKSRFYTQSNKSDPNIQHDREQMFSNLKSIIQNNQTILSSRTETTPIMRKKNETSKTSCTCNIQ